MNPFSQLGWLTQVNGILPDQLENAPTAEQILPHIKSILKDKILVGHALYNDLAYISHKHKYEDVRDTSLYYPIRRRMGVEREGEYPGLKKMYKLVFDTDIQVDVHDPVGPSLLSR